MKLENIKQRIGFVGSQKYTVHLHRIKHVLNEYKEEDNLDMNPDFQRAHVWTQVQQTKFIEFLLTGGKTSEILFNCLNWSRGENGDLVLVDGKQRLNAITKFFDNNLPVFGGNYINDIEDPQRFKRLYVTFVINELQSKEDVLNWYLEINTGGTPHTTEEITKVKKILSNIT